MCKLQAEILGCGIIGGDPLCLFRTIRERADYQPPFDNMTISATMTPVDPIWKTIYVLARSQDFLNGGSRMASAIRSFDWSPSGLGEPDQWPLALKSVMRMALASKQPICLFWGPQLTLIYNEAYAPFLGDKESGALGLPFRKVWADIWEDLEPLVRRTLSGESICMEDMPLLMSRNCYAEPTWWTFFYSPVCDDAGQIAGLINFASETTKAFTARRDLNDNLEAAQLRIDKQDLVDRRQRVVQREMVHRIKNTLAMAMAIVSQTMRNSASMEDAGDTISNRIAALASAQEILTQENSDSAEVRSVVCNALAPLMNEEGRIVLDGPALSISAQQALGLSLAVHELATNAVKYGALSNDAGQVAISWGNDDAAFRFEWRESGGPAVKKPAQSGFGSRLTGRIVPSYFSGKARTQYDPSGVQFTLEGKIDRPRSQDPGEQVASSESSPR